MKQTYAHAVLITFFSVSYYGPGLRFQKIPGFRKFPVYSWSGPVHTTVSFPFVWLSRRRHQDAAAIRTYD